MKEGKMNKQTNRKNNMNYKFNEDQINIIQHCLDIQEEIWSKNKSNREYYDADLRRLEGHNFRDSKNKAEYYERQKISYLEDRINTLEKSLERVHEILARLKSKLD